MANSILLKKVENPCKTLRKTQLKSLFKTMYNFFLHHPLCVNLDFFTSLSSIFHQSSHTHPTSVISPLFHYSTDPITTTIKIFNKRKELINEY